MKAFRSIIVSVILIATAQLLMKKGVTGVSLSFFNIPDLINIINPYLVVGLLSLFIGTIVWLSVLSKSELSYAYPILSLGYIFVALASMLWLGEQLGIVRWVGILTISVGVFLMSRS